MNIIERKDYQNYIYLNKMYSIDKISDDRLPNHYYLLKKKKRFNTLKYIYKKKIHILKKI